MADSLILIVLEQLASYVQQEVGLVVGVREEVGKLMKTFKMVQAVLNDAEEKQVKDRAVKVWLEELKDIAYVADDLLDEWQTRTRISQNQGDDDAVADVDVNAGKRKKVVSYLFCPCFCFRSVIIHYDIGQRIKEIRQRLDVVAHDKDQHKLIVMNHEEPRHLTSSHVNVSEICGRDHDKAIVMNMLLDENNSHQDMPVQVIAIIGTGGFGKTTLAKLVLKEEKVITTFEKKMWVCVSKPFDLVRVAREIIEQAGEKFPNVVGWDALHKCLCDSLKEKQFLLVLDDVWTDDANHWYPLKLSLDGGASGSRVLVTTRNEKVAEMMGSTQKYNLGELPEDDCWSLFRLIAFQGREEDLYKFEEIGRKLAKKCQGVPLAAKTLASLMRHKKAKRDWNNVLTSGTWDMQHVEKDILPSLFMSYYPLPSNLKQCFMYCAVFPKDMEISKDYLVKLWMAQGFVGSDGSKELEKIGEDYFDDLAMRSFFQDFVRDAEGSITSCKMHDLLHDFAQFLTASECTILETNDRKFDAKKIRHLATGNMDNSSIYLAKNLRTLLTLIEPARTVPIELYYQLTCLRALDLGGSEIEELSNEVGKLLHLRYLNLCGTNLSELPEAISLLYNLQTLELASCKRICKLPDGIGNLANLRHLGIKGTVALGCLPRGIGKLCFLRTLSKFIVGDVTSKGCKMGELKFLNFLQGNLEVDGLGQLTNMNEAADAELRKKKNLSGLTLHFSDLGEGDAVTMEGVLENLQPHENLEMLKIKEYPGTKFPSWITSGSNLVTLKLYKCEKCERLPALGKLASLEKLNVGGMSSMKHIGHEFFGYNVGGGRFDPEFVSFPKLKALVFRHMVEWEEWDFPFSKEMRIMPQLLELTLKDCPKLRELPALGRLESLEHLVIDNLKAVKQIRSEFCGLGIDSSSCAAEVISFPKLKKLQLRNMEDWEEWEFPVSKDTQMMPCLLKLRLFTCPVLRALPGFGKLKSLESLKIRELHSVKHIGAEFLGTSHLENGSDCTKSAEKELIFPRLRKLEINDMEHFEVWNLHSQKDRVVIMPRLSDFRLWFCPKLRALPDLSRLKSLETLYLMSLTSMADCEERDGDIIMPLLHAVGIEDCCQLKVIPNYIFSHTLRELDVSECPELRGIQPCLPPLLEKLFFSRDVGIFSNSLPVCNEECPHSNTDTYPNLKSVSIWLSLHSSLPKGFNQLTSIQSLELFSCKNLDFGLEELNHLTMLQHLYIEDCPVLKDRFGEGKDWSILSRVPKITIDHVKFTRN